MNARTTLFVTTLVLALSGSLALGNSFEGLGDLPGGPFQSGAQAVTPDGSVVVGASIVSDNWDAQAFRWEAGVMSGIDALPGDTRVSHAYGVSSDGQIIVGMMSSHDPWTAFRWEAGVMSDIEAAGGLESIAYGVSADGSTVVGILGISDAGFQHVPFRWTAPTGMVSLGVIPGYEGEYHIASDISADGTVIVGFAGTDSPQAFRWVDGAHSMLGFLRYLPGGPNWSYVSAVSPDGQVVVGQSISENGPEAFRWAGGVMSGLGDLPGGKFCSYANDASTDGAVVVGYGSTADTTTGYGQRAFIWDQANGMRNLRDVLVERGVDMTGWTLTWANAVSDNGGVIVGSGINPDGNTEGWIARMTYTLTVQINIEGAGSVTIEPNEAGYSPGQTVTLTGTAATGYEGTWWFGDVPPANIHDDPLVLTIDGDKTITAIFVPEEGVDPNSLRWRLGDGEWRDCGSGAAPAMILVMAAGCGLVTHRRRRR